MDLKSVDGIDLKIYLRVMEDFMTQVRDYAIRCGVKPATVVYWAGFAGNAWTRWEGGESSPTLRTLDKVRAYIAENPPPEDVREGAAA